MNRYEQVCLCLSRELATSPKAHVVIAIANHHRFEAGGLRQSRLKLARYFQYHLFFTEFLRARSAGVFSPVSRVDSNNDVAPPPQLFHTFGGYGALLP